MKHKRIGIGIAAVAAVAIATGFLLRPAPEPVVAVSAPPATVGHAPSPLAVPSGRPDAPAGTASSSPAAAKAGSKADEFNRLIRTGKPVDAYAAYKLAASCESEKAWAALFKQAPPEVQKVVVHEPQKACGDLSPGQVASRLELLRIALDAGVHGALASLVTNEGPAGILHTIPDGPEWRAMELAALDAGVKTADPYALVSRSSYYMNCHNSGQQCEPSEADKTKALMYWVAFQEAKALNDGRPPMVSSSGETVVERYSKMLPPEVAKKAIDDGKTLVALARGQR